MEGAQNWSNTSVAVVSAAGWSRASIVAGQRELERIRREVDAAFAALVIADGGDDRDSAARIARSVNVSTRCARERVRVASVCDAVPAALAALASGDVSSEHVSALASVIDDPEAAELIELGAVQSPEEFWRTVTRHRLKKDPADVRKRQRDARSLSFFDGERGCVGVRGLLPPVDGEELKNVLTAIADAQWKKEHPDRAPVWGGHGGDSWNARMADALMALVRGQVGFANGQASPKVQSPSKSGKPALVITIDAKTLDAELIGHGPISLEDALEVAARAELYGAIRDMSGEILNFGRSRRFASAIQNLALVVRDKQCMYPGCDGHWTMTDAHHTHEFENGGLTDLEWLARVCQPHHTYLHANDLRLVKRDGVWVVEPAGPEESDTR
jgi:Domain of unknown function (DUF222)